MASIGSEFSICLTLSTETYWGQDWAKELIYAWERSSQVKFYKPLNEDRVLWLGATERGVYIRALVEVEPEPEPVNCGYELLWAKVGNKISSYNPWGVVDAEWKPADWENWVSRVQDGVWGV